MTNAAQPPLPRRMRPGPSSKRLAEMLRVDHAGEYGAVRIYAGQRAVFAAAPGKAATAAMIAKMEAGESRHLEAFDALLAERRVRPTLLSPIWNAAGFALGAATALMGEKAAMACTSIVEEEIERHYAAQAEELAARAPDLAKTIETFRQDELDHKAAAEQAGARDAAGFQLMRTLIGAGCRLAIRLSEKI